MFQKRTVESLLALLAVLTLRPDAKGQSSWQVAAACLAGAVSVDDAQDAAELRQYFSSFDADAALSYDEAKRILELSQADWPKKVGVIRFGLSQDSAAETLRAHVPYFASAVLGLDPTGELSDLLARDVLKPAIQSSTSSTECVATAFELLLYLRDSSNADVALMLKWLNSDEHDVSDLGEIVSAFAFAAHGQDAIDFATLLVDEVISRPTENHWDSISNLEILANSLPPREVGRLARRLAAQRESAGDDDAIRNLDNALGSLGAKLAGEDAAVLVQQITKSMSQKRDAHSIAEDAVLMRRLTANLGAAEIRPVAHMCTSKLENLEGVYPVNMIASVLTSVSEQLAPPEVLTIVRAMLARILSESDAAVRGVLLEAVVEMTTRVDPAVRPTILDSVFIGLQNLDAYHYCEVVNAVGKSQAAFSPLDRKQCASRIVDLIIAREHWQCGHALNEALAESLKDLPANRWSSISKTYLDYLDDSAAAAGPLRYETLGALASGVAPAEVYRFAHELVGKICSEEDLFQREQCLEWLQPLAGRLTRADALRLCTPLIDRLQDEQDASMIVDLGDAILILSADLEDERLQPAIAAIARRVEVEQEDNALEDLAGLLVNYGDRWDSRAASSFVLDLAPRIRTERDDRELIALTQLATSFFDVMKPDECKLICEVIAERFSDVRNGDTLVQLAEADAGLAHLDQPSRRAAAEVLLGSLSRALFSDVRWFEYADFCELPGLASILKEAELQSLVDAIKAPLLNDDLTLGAVAQAVSWKTGKSFNNLRQFVEWAASDPQAQQLNLDLTGGGPWATADVSEQPEFPPIVGLNVVQQGAVRIDAAVWSFCVQGDMAYLPAGVSGLLLIDVSSPENPRKVGRADAGPYAMAVDVAGDYAFVTAGPAGWPESYLHIVDVSQAAAPKLVSKIDLPDYPSGVAARDDRVYVADRSEGLRIIDVSDPKDPKEIGSLPTPGIIVDVALTRNYALLADGEVGLRVVDVASPDSPKQISVFQTDGPCLDVAVHGRRAYLATGEDGVVVLDVAQPESLQEIVTLPVGFAASVAAFDDFVAVGSARLGVYLFDLSNPDRPTARQLPMEANGGGVSYRGDTLFVSDLSFAGGPYGIGDHTTLRLFRLAQAGRR